MLLTLLPLSTHPIPSVSQFPSRRFRASPFRRLSPCGGFARSSVLSISGVWGSACRKFAEPPRLLALATLGVGYRGCAAVSRVGPFSRSRCLGVVSAFRKLAGSPGPSATLSVGWQRCAVVSRVCPFCRFPVLGGPAFHRARFRKKRKWGAP